MENWLHWAETFCPVIAHDVLKESCPQAFDAWMQLRRAFLHDLCSHEWYDHLDARQKEKARVEAKVSMRTYAEFVESKLAGIQFCIINLRMLHNSALVRTRDSDRPDQAHVRVLGRKGHPVV